MYSEILRDLQDRHDKIEAVIIALRNLEGIAAPPSDVEKMTVKAIPVPAPAARKAAHKLKPPATNDDPKTRTHKPCNKCRKDKPLSEFPPNSQCADGHVGECKGCRRIRSSANWRKKHGKVQPTAAETAAPATDLKCRLCNALASTPDRLASHMRIVHDMSPV